MTDDPTTTADETEDGRTDSDSGNRSDADERNQWTAREEFDDPDRMEELEEANAELRERVAELESIVADIAPGTGTTDRPRAEQVDDEGGTDSEAKPVLPSGGQPQKVVGKFENPNGGVGVYGHNTATSGTTYGVWGEVNSPDGYGIATPDAARIEGAIDTNETDFVVEAGTQSTEDAQNVVLGHASNDVTDAVEGATISGGGSDSGSVDRSHEVTSDYGTVAGGRYNTVSGSSGTVGGGYNNTASGSSGTTVGGGLNNTASGYSATVGGGSNNTASGIFSTVLGGYGCRASGQYSIAGGRNATAPKDGQVVFTDSNGANPSNTSDRFHGRFDKGYRLETDAENYGTGVYMGNGDSSWSSLSDPETKTNIRSVDEKTVLDGVADLDISRWSYEWQTDIEHMGPMAGDLYEKFGVGRDDRGIQTIDAFGVLFAAVQGLAERVKQLEGTTTEES
jgi:hypothetical protein